MDDARSDGCASNPFKRPSPLRASATATRVFTVGAPYPHCPFEVSVEELQLRKPLTSRSDECRASDTTVPELSKVNSHGNSQRPELVCAAQRAGKPPTSLPPTGGIALLIDILAREALKELMIKRSNSCKPRNLR